MNLQDIIAGAINTVNPSILGTVMVSSGQTTNPDGTVTPAYTTIPNVPMQVQALSAREIEHLDRLNVQGVSRSVYLDGNIEGLDRPLGKGGDLLVFNGQTWLVVQVMETWDTGGWCRVAVRLQNGS